MVQLKPLETLWVTREGVGGKRCGGQQAVSLDSSTALWVNE